MNELKHWFLVFILIQSHAYSQNLQLHYDFRHSVDPAHNKKNFPTLYFEYFKGKDSSSFLLKMQSDLADQKNNIGKFYVQVAGTWRFWKPKIFIHLSYSGGLGLSEPRQYSYSIYNTYAIGLSYSFQWKGVWFSSVLDYKLVPYKKLSNDFLYTIYWWKGLLNYKLELAGDFSGWTENKNHGDDLTMNERGKRFSFFGEPQIWLNLNKTFAIGTKINLYYHVLTYEHIFQAYPTLATRCKF